MHITRQSVAVPTTLLILLAVALSGAAADKAPKKVVLVELFTSQG